MEQCKGQCHAADFLFAFNDSNFSDRMLQIQVLPDSEGGDDMLDLITDCRRGIEDDPKSASNHIGSGMAMDYSNIAVRVNSLYVSSAILAEKSAFFRKLFSNGRRESKKSNITLQISCSEEMAFTDLLQYMYGGTPGARSTKELLNVLMVADKFEVTSCVEWCSSALQNSPMSTETALLYMDLIPQSLLTSDSVKSLIDTAKKFILQQFGDLEKFAEDLTNLPLSVIEAVLSSDGLQVESEDALFDFVIKWARKHYSNIEERREVLSNRLCQLIRFPNMSHHKLNNVISCSDLDTVYGLKAVSEALHLKAQAPHKRCNERDYKHFPVTVLEFDAPIRECTVYWNIKKSQPMPLYSQPFRFDGLNFQIRCVEFDCPVGFKVIIGVMDLNDEQRLDSDIIEADLTIRMLPSCDFRHFNGNKWQKPLRSFTGEGAFLPVYFLAEGRPLFVNDVRHFRRQGQDQGLSVFVNDVIHLRLQLAFRFL